MCAGRVEQLVSGRNLAVSWSEASHRAGCVGSGGEMSRAQAGHGVISWLVEGLHHAVDNMKH